MLARNPATGKKFRRLERRRREALRGRLGRARYDALLASLVALHRLSKDAGQVVTYFALEGTLRAAVRSDLCLQGWSWSEADQVARTLLAEVYRTLRAERPSWGEGQPEWVQHAGTLIERTRCAKCHKTLPEGHSKFCSRICATSFHDRLAKVRRANEDQIAALASGWI